MDAAKLREILRIEYGINSEEEFDAAAKKSKGINIGIFTTPLYERSVEIVEKRKAQIGA